MKPRLRFVRKAGRWVCHEAGLVGWGWTARQAYADWSLLLLGALVEVWENRGADDWRE
ncbi:hypothetical protein [Rhizobacter sp. Root1221]|uniref:hypothetical protein n=1 Tax=Rhizobacter sp. Root1221 TaxID=1736433 RepID=UPI000A822615|nr:hypothetical protein [Rhizobacter sp. Root1221]